METVRPRTRGYWGIGCRAGPKNSSRPLKPEEEGIAGGFEAWTLWGVVSGPMLCDLAGVPPYGDLTGGAPTSAALSWSYGSAAAPEYEPRPWFSTGLPLRETFHRPSLSTGSP